MSRPFYWGCLGTGRATHPKAEQQGCEGLKAARDGVDPRGEVLRQARHDAARRCKAGAGPDAGAVCRDHDERLAVRALQAGQQPAVDLHGCVLQKLARVALRDLREATFSLMESHAEGWMVAFWRSAGLMKRSQLI